MASSEAAPVQLRERRRVSTATYHRTSQFFDVVPTSPSITIEAHVNKRILSATINAERTIEQLARHIEYIYKQEYPNDPPFYCCLLLDEDGVPLDFAETVGDQLASDSVVHAMSADDEPEDPRTTNRRSLLYQYGSAVVSSTSDLSQFSSTESLKSADINAVAVRDSEFRAALRNKICLKYFREYCTAEYSVENLLFWLDVETYRSIPEGDEELRLQVARRIYNTYVAQNAPLQINLGQDVRHIIDWPMPGVSPDVFDEAQAHIYALMKAHSFKRFLQSSHYARLEKEIQADPAAYQAAYIDDIGEFFLHYVDKDTVPVLARGAATDPASLAMRERTLTKIMRRYWEEAQEAKGYITQKTQLTSLQKQRRLQKHKKLTKFFGERPAEAQLKHQHSREFAGADDGHDLDGGAAGAGGAVALTQQRSREYGDDLTAEVDSDSHLSKKKRAEKLEGFFGDRLPNRELFTQNLVVNAPQPVALHEDPDEDELLPRPKTTNELSSDEKKAMTKRTRKLKGILGEPIGEQHVPVSPRTVSGRTAGPRTARFLDWLSGASASITGAQTRRPSLEELQRYIAEQDAARLSSSSPYSDSSGLSPFSTGSLSVPVSPHVHYSSPSLVGDDDGDLGSPSSSSLLFSPSVEVALSKEQRQKKLVKLQQFLGERLSAKWLTLQRILNEPKSPRTPLSSDDKKQQQRKMYKLERVFGEMPPQHLIIRPDDPWQVKNVKSLQMLTYLLEHNVDTDLSELIDFMDSQEGSMTALHERFSRDDTEDPRRRARTMRQRRVNKLHRFFGDPLTEQAMLEHRILEELVVSFEEEVAADETLHHLRPEVEQLKAQVRKRTSSQESRRSLEAAPMAEIAAAVAAMKTEGAAKASAPQQ